MFLCDSVITSDHLLLNSLSASFPFLTMGYSIAVVLITFFLRTRQSHIIACVAHIQLA